VDDWELALADGEPVAVEVKCSRSPAYLLHAYEQMRVELRTRTAVMLAGVLYRSKRILIARFDRRLSREAFGRVITAARAPATRPRSRAMPRR
jgi:hypothetical protein